MTSRFLSHSWLLATALLATSACKIQIPDRGDDQYIIGLRVMDVKSEPAEVAAGGMTMLSALVDDTMGRPIDVAWTYCDAVPPMNSTLNDDCVTLDSGPNIHPIGNGMTTPFTMPTVDPAVLGDPDQSNGVYLPIRAVVTAGTDVQKTIYRIRVNMGGTPNQNPTISGLYQVMTGAGTPSDGGTMVLDGGDVNSGSDLLVPIDPANPMPVHSGDKIQLRALYAMGSAESYMVPGRPNDSGMATMRNTTERLDITWYSTGGTLGDAPFTGNGDMGMGMGMMGGFGGGGTRDTVLTLDNNVPPTGYTIELWAVVRDGRGGSDYQHRTLVVQ